LQRPAYAVNPEFRSQQVRNSPWQGLSALVRGLCPNGQGIARHLTITAANAINNAGVIAVTADDRRTAKHETLSFILTPVQ